VTAALSIAAGVLWIEERTYRLYASGL
jgi:hypothetical protein